jgi:hypothetical protein
MRPDQLCTSNLMLRFTITTNCTRLGKLHWTGPNHLKADDRLTLRPNQDLHVLTTGCGLRLGKPVTIGRIAFRAEPNRGATALAVSRDLKCMQ